MLDRKLMAVLQAVNDLCVSGTYEILSVDDILNEIPKRLAVEEKFIHVAIDALAEKRLISVKYSDEQEFCLAPLPDGKMKCEQKSEEDAPTAQKSNKKTALYCLIASFLGSMLGGAIIVLILKLSGI